MLPQSNALERCCDERDPLDGAIGFAFKLLPEHVGIELAVAQAATLRTSEAPEAVTKSVDAGDDRAAGVEDDATIGGQSVEAFADE